MRKYFRLEKRITTSSTTQVGASLDKVAVAELEPILNTFPGIMDTAMYWSITVSMLSV